MPTKEVTLEALRSALALMNSKGKHWTQGALRRNESVNGKERVTYCSVGAIWQISGVNVERVSKGYMSGYDDADDELRSALTKALALAVPEDARPTETFGPIATDRREQETAIVRYNDNNDRTWNEIVALFKRAETLVEEGAV